MSTSAPDFVFDKFVATKRNISFLDKNGEQYVAEVEKFDTINPSNVNNGKYNHWNVVNEDGNILHNLFKADEFDTTSGIYAVARGKRSGNKSDRLTVKPGKDVDHLLNLCQRTSMFFTLDKLTNNTDISSTAKKCVVKKTTIKTDSKTLEFDQIVKEDISERHDEELRKFPSVRYMYSGAGSIHESLCQRFAPIEDFRTTDGVLGDGAGWQYLKNHNGSEQIADFTTFDDTYPLYADAVSTKTFYDDRYSVAGVELVRDTKNPSDTLNINDEVYFGNPVEEKIVRQMTGSSNDWDGEDHTNPDSGRFVDPVGGASPNTGVDVLKPDGKPPSEQSSEVYDEMEFMFDRELGDYITSDADGNLFKGKQFLPKIGDSNCYINGKLSSPKNGDYAIAADGSSGGKMSGYGQFWFKRESERLADGSINRGEWIYQYPIEEGGFPKTTNIPKGSYELLYPLLNYDYSIDAAKPYPFQDLLHWYEVDKVRSYKNVDVNGPMVYLVYRHDQKVKSEEFVPPEEDNSGIIPIMNVKSHLLNTTQVSETELDSKMSDKDRNQTDVDVFQNYETVESLDGINRLGVGENSIKSNLFSVSISNLGLEDNPSISEKDRNRIHRWIVDKVDHLAEELAPANTHLFKTYISD